MSLELGPKVVKFQGKEMDLLSFGSRIRALVSKDKKEGGEGIRLMVRVRPGMTIGRTETFLRLVQEAGVRAVDFL
ncbi:MAG TPA: hypothetical protein ENK02_13450 [Planctomycetes bacterium]|nr:hypothetical protein [Planctomycetota bacterium]